MKCPKCKQEAKKMYYRSTNNGGRAPLQCDVCHNKAKKIADDRAARIKSLTQDEKLERIRVLKLEYEQCFQILKKGNKDDEYMKAKERETWLGQELRDLKKSANYDNYIDERR